MVILFCVIIVGRDNMSNDMEELFKRLECSKFRSRFKLREKDIIYVNEKGLDKIREHAYDFVNKRLAPKVIVNEGKQTPMRGHPVFIAQHATATCCRKCLYKWHHIFPNKELSREEVDYIVDVIMTFIVKSL